MRRDVIGIRVNRAKKSGMVNITSSVIFFFNDTATTEIYTLSLHDALPISVIRPEVGSMSPPINFNKVDLPQPLGKSTLLKLDRKSTRLNSSHSQISYAVFCLKKKKQSE